MVEPNDPASIETPQPGPASELPDDEDGAGFRTMAEPTGEQPHRWRFVGSFPFLVIVALGVAIII